MLKADYRLAGTTAVLARPGDAIQALRDTLRAFICMRCCELSPCLPRLHRHKAHRRQLEDDRSVRESKILAIQSSRFCDSPVGSTTDCVGLCPVTSFLDREADL